MSLASSSSSGASIHLSQAYSYTPMIPRTQFSEAFTDLALEGVTVQPHFHSPTWLGCSAKAHQAGGRTVPKAGRARQA
ncbi:hypothetical protein BD310DRAFT_919994 [Dichomitus squalens]|uniref:Uncharacterized protein n=1 Tax=Dichomitus squalens TaxID=114155 RepID=A0A4Q9Q3U7_9APHY|nr:hypothetical protein BD310DRAFT_919994 [Dichomitus squalens]